jgi:hypothetical protein
VKREAFETRNEREVRGTSRNMFKIKKKADKPKPTVLYNIIED